MSDLSTIKNLFGLIGFPLSHSFSKGYFAKKFKKEEIEGCYYESFPLEHISHLPVLISKYPQLRGLNVTIPYKQAVFPYLDEIEEEAAAVGAVNTIKILDGKRIGYNTDVFGFEISLQQFLEKGPALRPESALILGTGGASKAVAHVLKKMKLPYLFVSRTSKDRDGLISYSELDETIMATHQLIINTTPLGMSPNIKTYPSILYDYIGSQHYLYDLVYNPEKTSFLIKGEKQGASICNGLEMLHLQAERSWQIWQSKD